MRRGLTILLLIIAVATQGQEIVSKVMLKEKQNQMAAEVPKILIDAMSRGDIVGYYPKNTKIPVSYSQFLYHFGMTERAYRALMQTSPGWDCETTKPVPIDDYALDCMEYQFEIVEQMQRNNVTYAQERKMKYVRLIFSNTCTLDGLDVAGPIFKISDIGDLVDRRYGITNPQNPAVKYSVLELLRLKLYSAR
jgi:hypothetical protein